jgi:hypothetical protein
MSFEGLMSWAAVPATKPKEPWHSGQRFRPF